ncbi:MAG TPA: hypothetical protein VFU31_30485 [Candidatus Binatia bacterium]|nr:hypothetical protein [Candidatus Binatia bacterium]
MNHPEQPGKPKKFIPMPKPPAKATERPEPVEYRHIIKLEWLRQFTLWERICILFGSSLVVQAGVATRHQPGPIQPLFIGKVSKTLTADERNREIIENMLAAKRESPVQNESKPENS